MGQTIHQPKIFPAASAKKLAVSRAESYNHHGSYSPDRAYDGDLSTFYAVRDGAVNGNFLKLYLPDTFSIGEVILVCRRSDYDGIADQMLNTEVRVYSTDGGETEVARCGTITGNHVINHCLVRLMNNHNS